MTQDFFQDHAADAANFGAPQVASTMAETQELPNIDKRFGIHKSQHEFSDLLLDSRKKSTGYQNQNAAMLM